MWWVMKQCEAITAVAMHRQTRIGLARQYSELGYHATSKSLIETGLAVTVYTSPTTAESRHSLVVSTRFGSASETRTCANATPPCKVGAEAQRVAIVNKLFPLIPHNGANVAESGRACRAINDAMNTHLTKRPDDCTWPTAATRTGHSLSYLPPLRF